MKAEELDMLFDQGDTDITPYLDLSRATRASDQPGSSGQRMQSFPGSRHIPHQPAFA